jgi:hypothetical protein
MTAKVSGSLTTPEWDLLHVLFAPMDPEVIIAGSRKGLGARKYDL